PGGNLFEDWYGSSGWSGWGEVTGGNDGEALAGGPAVAYDSDNGTFHAFAVGKNSGSTFQVTFVPGTGWTDWQNLGGTVQNGGLSATYVAPPDLGKNIADIAEGQLGYTEPSFGSYCNKFSTYWGQGCEEWCADFAAWTWQQAGVSFTYAWTTGDINGGAVSFYHWASAKGTWHPAGSGYTPRPGDAVVYGVNSSGTWAAHVAIVTSYTPGDAGPNVVNGDFSHAVQAGTDQTTNGGGYGISGYASPA
ncbi:hypothetical protein ABH935_001419, partial [Catenulispora sp. GAS73]|uniref:CHAP domain-containing protein n=1 Tax=Catenulispora sp. GAS73 TaxID=3156269 RepID=UPI0035139E8E